MRRSMTAMQEPGRGCSSQQLHNYRRVAVTGPPRLATCQAPPNARPPAARLPR